MGPTPHLTEEQLAKAAARRAAKEAKKAAQASGVVELNEDQLREKERSRFLVRGWVGPEGKPVGGDGNGQNGEGRGWEGECVRIVTWNILAQTLIRRELFPGSDCLRWGDRKAMLEAEMAHHGRHADILCLQECDRLKDLMHKLPFDSCVQGRGHGKQHGLVILYRSDRFDFVSSKVVHLDEEHLSPLHSDTAVISPEGRDAEGQPELEEGEKRRRGGTRQTKNVGLMLALRTKSGQGGDADADGHREKGVVIVTTHLFWHPKYQYERIRQLIVLTRAVRAFQSMNGIEAWPVVLAGDLNTTPAEPTYQLLVNPSVDLPPAAIESVNGSRIVHDSVQKIGKAHIPRSARGEVPHPEAQSGTGESSNVPSAGPSVSGTGTTTPVSNGDGAVNGNGVVDPANANITPPRTTQQNTASGAPAEKDDEGEGELPDSNEKSLANTRLPAFADGVREITELQGELRNLIGDGVRSAYTAWPWTGGQEVEGGVEGRVETFASRGGFDQQDDHGVKWDLAAGGGEPGYTCYTALFKLTLDYLFVLPTHPAVSGDEAKRDGAGAVKGLDVRVKSVLKPAAASELGEGLPKKGISASDHVAVGAEFAW